MLDPDRLAIFADILQVMTFLEVLTEGNNNDILQELQRQNKEYLEQIIKQNNEILERLENYARKIK